MGRVSKLLSYIKANGINNAVRVFMNIQRNKRFRKIDALPIDDKIVFECESDMDDNPRAIYEYIIAKGMNKEYKIVWLVKNVKFCRKTYKKKNVVFINRFDHSRKNQLKLRRHLSTAKWLLFSHPYWFKKIKPEQVVIHTGHGTPLKDRGKQDLFISHTWDKMLVTTEKMKPFYMQFWQCPEEKTFLCGNPRNDFLFRNRRKEIIPKLFVCSNDEKIVMCMPTYRKSAARNDCQTEDKFALGVIHTEEEFLTFNEFLKEQKIHIIVKLHPLQVLDEQFLQSVSNIHYVLNKELFEKQILLYELLGCCDALLTDFSSVFFDYLQLNRPVAFFMNDFGNYDRGFLVEDPLVYMPGEKLYKGEDLCDFLQSLSAGSDAYQQDRACINEWVNYSKRPDNSKRFVHLTITGELN